MSKVLGKGLDALIKKYDSEESSRYLSGQIPIDKIQPNTSQPRQIFDKIKMQELELSIKKKWDYSANNSKRIARWKL